jgi:Ca2+-binding RTX toxin-like protein
MVIYYGTNAGDAFTGTSAADEFFCYDGNDVVYGSGGNDTVWDSFGQDTVWGGFGQDTINYSASTAVRVDLERGVIFSPQDGQGSFDYLYDVEHVVGGARQLFTCL